MRINKKTVVILLSLGIIVFFVYTLFGKKQITNTIKGASTNSGTEGGKTPTRYAEIGWL